MQCLCFRTEWQGKHSTRVYLKNTRTSYHARTTQNKVKRTRRNIHTYRKSKRRNTRTLWILTGPSRDETLARNREYVTEHYQIKCKTIPDSRRTDKRQNSSPKLRTFTTHTKHIIFKGNKTSLYHLKQLKFNVVPNSRQKQDGLSSRKPQQLSKQVDHWPIKELGQTTWLRHMTEPANHKTGHIIMTRKHVSPLFQKKREDAAAALAALAA